MKYCLTIGVTGSFGTGKSTVARILRRLSNGYLIDADKIARKLVNNKLKSRIVKEFGTAKRKELADVVFSDTKKLNKLNSIVHPRVKKEIKKQIKECKKRVAIIDAPLLIEAKIRCNRLIVVKTSRKTQIKRLGRRFKKADIIKRIRSQMTITNKLKHSDYVINNNGSLRDTENQIKKIWNKIRIGV